MKTEPKETKSTAKKFIIGTVVVFIVFGATIAVLLKAPELLQDKVYDDTQVKRLETQLEQLAKKVAILENQSSTVKKKDVTDLYVRFDEFSRSVNESLALKAQSQEVSNLSHQVSQMEKKIKATSSQNALILTALGLVENVAQTGTPFIYEASVLNGLCLGTELEQDAEKISEIAASGISLDQDLVEKFQIMYDEAQHAKPTEKSQEPKEENRDWKSFLLNKLKNLIVFEKIKKQDLLMKTPEEEVLQSVKDGHFEKAVLQMDRLQFFQTENFEIWKEMWRTREKFENLMEKMKAYSLGALKVENLKK